jgi:hypothetical protein
MEKIKNDRSFEDCERMVVELKAFFFKTVYLWTTTFDGLHITNFLDFLDLLSFFGYVFLLYTSCVFG